MESLDDALVLILARLLIAFLSSSLLFLVLEVLGRLRDRTEGWLLSIGLAHELLNIAVLGRRMAWARVTKSVTHRPVGLIHASKLSFRNFALHANCIHGFAPWAVQGRAGEW